MGSSSTRTSAVAALLVLCGLVWWLPLERLTLEMTAWLTGAGWLGILLYAAGFVVGSLLFFPGLPMVMAAGFAYGPVMGFAVALPAATAAAAATFAAGRWLGHLGLEEWITSSPRLHQVRAMSAIGGFRLVLLLRLSPLVPFTLLGYAMGLSRIRFKDFIVASTLGKAPGLALYVYLASVVRHVSELKITGQSGPAEGYYWLGLAATLLAAWQVTRVAKEHQRRLLKESQQYAAADSVSSP